MTRYRVVFRLEAAQQLEELYDFIANAASPSNAGSFTESIVAFCEGLADFPRDSTRRPPPGLRTIGYKKPVVVAYAVLNETVAVVGIFYGGQDHEALLASAEQPD